MKAEIFTCHFWRAQKGPFRLLYDNRFILIEIMATKKAKIMDHEDMEVMNSDKMKAEFNTD